MSAIMTHATGAGLSSAEVSLPQHPVYTKHDHAKEKYVPPEDMMSSPEEVATPIISNRLSCRKDNLPPLDLPRATLDMDGDHTETPLELRKISMTRPLSHPQSEHDRSSDQRRHSDQQQGNPLDETSLKSSASSASTKSTEARFSPESAPPIVLKQWPSSKRTKQRSSSQEHSQQNSKIPQTISVQKSVLVRGIPNFGQTCFLNAVLQSLASLKAFRAYLDSQMQAHDQVQASLNSSSQYSLDHQHQNNSLSLPLTEMLSNGLRFINGEDTLSTSRKWRCSHWDTRPLLQAVANAHQQFRNTHQQQDAQELMAALLDVLVQEQDGKHTRDKHSLVSPRSWRSMVSSTEDREDDEAPPASVSLASAVPSTVWALSSTFLQAKSLPPLIDENHEWNENGWMDDSISLASASRLNSSRAKVPTATNHPKPPMDAVTPSTSVSSASSSDDAADCSKTTDEAKRPQETFEVTIPRVNSEANMSDLSAAMSQSAHQSAISTTTTTLANHSTNRTVQGLKQALRWSMPLSGWMGSTLQCRACSYVRPIRNVPFVDLSIVPTDVANIVHHSGRPCTVEHCLADFTKVERVDSVECPSCTKRAYTQKAQDEVDFWHFTLKEAKKIHEKKGGSMGELESMTQEYESHKFFLERLKALDIDHDDFAKELSTITQSRHEILPDQSCKLLREDADKCLFLTRLPPVFCLHVQRRFYDPKTGYLSKTNQRVVFNEYLDLAPFCAYSAFQTSTTPQIMRKSTTAPSWAAGTSRQIDIKSAQAPQKRGILYRLAAVLEHRGGANSGHYVCYRRISNSEWCYISDQDVRRVSWEVVQRAQAYLLLYENSHVQQQ